MRHDHLTALRDLLHDAPEAARWDALLDLLGEDHPDATLHRDYAAHLLDQRWPGHLRALPPALARALAEGAAPWPILALCRAWDDRGINALTQHPALLAHPDLAHLTALHLHADAFADLDADALPWSTGLRNLALHGPSTHEPRQLTDALTRADLPRLHALTLYDLDLTTLVPDALARIPWLPQLSQLTCAGLRLPADTATPLLRALSARLTALTFDACALDALPPLAAWPCAPTLEHLTLTANPRLDLGALLHPTCALPALRTLALAFCHDPDHRAFDALRQRDLPALRALRLTASMPSMEPLLAWSALDQLRALDLPHLIFLNDTQFAALAASPRLNRLEHLHLASCTFDISGLRDLARHDALPALRTLDLDLILTPSNDALSALAALPLARHVEHLAVSLPPHPRALLFLLSGARAWPALHTLALPHSAIGAEGAEHLARWPGLAHLTTLDLRGCEIGDDGLRILLASPHLGRLHTLRLDANALGAHAAEALAACPRLAHLHTLSLADNKLGSNEARILASSPHLTRLRRLDLAYNHRLRTAGTRALTTSPHLPALSHLRVRAEAAPSAEALHHNNPRLRLFTTTPRWDDPFDAARHNSEGAS